MINTGQPRGHGGDPSPFLQQQLYPTQRTNIPLATGIEAQLIIAEHHDSGRVGAYVTILNTLRATVLAYRPW